MHHAKQQALYHDSHGRKSVQKNIQPEQMADYDLALWAKLVGRAQSVPASLDRLETVTDCNCNKLYF